MRELIRALAIGLTLCAFGAAARAQQWPLGWAPVGNTVSLSASSSTSNVQLGWAAVSPKPQPPQSVVVCNQSTSVSAYVTLGYDSTVQATTSTGFPVMPNYCALLNLNSATYLAGITASSAAPLAISSGTGLPFASSRGGGGGTQNSVLLTGGTNLLTIGTDLATE